MLPQVHGLLQAEPVIASDRAMWHGFNPFCRSQSYFLFIVVIHLVSRPNGSILAEYLS